MKLYKPFSDYFVRTEKPSENITFEMLGDCFQVQARITKECSLTATLNGEIKTETSAGAGWNVFKFKFDGNRSETNNLVTLTTTGGDNCVWAISTIETCLISTSKIRAETNQDYRAADFTNLSLTLTIAFLVIMILILAGFLIRIKFQRSLKQYVDPESSAPNRKGFFRWGKTWFQVRSNTI